MLSKNIKSGDPHGKLTIRVDKAAALRWLSEHGVPRACLGFQFGHACKAARRWQSCGARTANHTEKPEGPHKIADGWMEAALTFVHPADKKAFA